MPRIVAAAAAIAARAQRWSSRSSAPRADRATTAWDLLPRGNAGAWGRSTRSGDPRRRRAASAEAPADTVPNRAVADMRLDTCECAARVPAHVGATPFITILVISCAEQFSA